MHFRLRSNWITCPNDGHWIVYIICTRSFAIIEIENTASEGLFYFKTIDQPQITKLLGWISEFNRFFLVFFSTFLSTFLLTRHKNSIMRWLHGERLCPIIFQSVVKTNAIKKQNIRTSYILYTSPLKKNVKQQTKRHEKFKGQDF